MDGSGREEGWGDEDDEEEEGGEEGGNEVEDEHGHEIIENRRSGSGSGSKGSERGGTKIPAPSLQKPTPRSPPPRPERWESGKGRCAVTGRRVLGGTEGLRRVMV